jgi:hypothetical protein
VISLAFAQGTRNIRLRFQDLLCRLRVCCVSFTTLVILGAGVGVDVQVRVRVRVMTRTRGGV